MKTLVELIELQKTVKNAIESILAIPAGYLDREKSEAIYRLNYKLTHIEDDIEEINEKK